MDSACSNDEQHNFWLCLLCEYIWDESDGQYSGCKNIDLTNWLISENLNVRDELWYFSTKVDVRKRKKINLTDGLSKEELRKAKMFNGNRIMARLAFDLRLVLPTLIASKNNVRYIDEEGQTVLHIFIQDFLKSSENFSLEDISRLKKFFMKLMKDAPLLFINDVNRKTPLDIAANCKSNEVLKVILSTLVDVNACDQFENTALHIVMNNCCDEKRNRKDGYLDFVQILVSKGADINAKNGSGITPVHLAVQNFHAEIFKFFIDNGIGSCQYGPNDMCPLYFAAHCKNDNILKSIVSSLKYVDVRDYFGNTALHIVIDKCIDNEGKHKYGYMEIVKILISKGADINAWECDGKTAVHSAAEKFNVEMLKFFAECGADFGPQTYFYAKSPLHFACSSSIKLKDSKKITETFEFLVSRGCDIEAADSKGYKPIHYAAEIGAIEIVERLIELGVDLNCRTQELDITPLHLAAKKDRLDVITKLVDAGANINAQAWDGTTPICLTAMLGSCESMQFLINKGADLYKRDNISGFTLLHLAASDVDTEIEKEAPANILARETKEKLRKIDVLLKKNFDVNDASICGITPLHLAVVRHNFYNVKILIEHGSNVNFQSEKSALTALHLAVIGNDFEIAKILIENMADVNCRGGAELMTPLHMAVASEIHWKLGEYPANTKPNENKSCIKEFWPNTNTTLISDCHRLVMLLIDNEAEVNIKDDFGRTPLHLVTLRRQNRTMKELLNAGIHVNVQDENHRLPFHNVLEKNNAEGLKLLLDYGLNVNDTDTAELIVNSNDELRGICLQYIIKLKLVGLPISNVYETLIDTSKFSDFAEQCSAEVIKLINSCDANVSLYKFLRMDPKFQYLYIGNINTSYMNLEEMFPIYSGLVRALCVKSTYRKQLLELARIRWTTIFKIYLPSLCIEIILSYLDNRYLEVFALSISNYEKIHIDNGANDVIVGSCTYTT